jgi:peptidyl-prolyl cis-trans isomerase C
MQFIFRRPSLVGIGLAFGLSAIALSPLAAQETAPAQAEGAAPAATVDPNAVVATVGGKPITEADLILAEGELSQQFARLPADQRRAAFLQERALHGEIVQKEVVGKITDEEIRARYDKEVAAQPAVNEVHARHILVKTKEEAEAIIKQLDGGAKFEDLANEHTTDPSGKTSGGDLGWFGPGQMVPAFEQAAMSLEPGSYTKEPVQTQFGWHIVKVEDKRPKQPPAFEEVKEQVRSAVLRDKYFAMVKELRGAANVEIPDPELKKAVDAAEGNGE